MTTTLGTDLQLRDAILDELRWTPSIDSADIGVAVSHRVVTLSGEVDSFPEKWHAEQAALRIRGVDAVAEQITVRATTDDTTDADIERHANDALERAVDVPQGSVQAAVHQRLVTLSGSTAWQYERNAAARAVRYLKGVAGVINAITVQPTVAPSGITAAIESAFRRNAQFEGAEIAVTTVGGEVTLGGQVHTWTERHQAETAAWSAPGVTSVLNHLTIDH